MKNLLSGIALGLGLLGASAIPAAAHSATYQNVYYYYANGDMVHVETVQVVDTGTYGYHANYQHGYGFHAQPQIVVYVENQFLLPAATQYFGKPYHQHHYQSHQQYQPVHYRVGFP